MDNVQAFLSLSLLLCLTHRCGVKFAQEREDGLFGSKKEHFHCGRARLKMFPPARVCLIVVVHDDNDDDDADAGDGQGGEERVQRWAGREGLPETFRESG